MSPPSRLKSQQPLRLPSCFFPSRWKTVVKPPAVGECIGTVPSSSPQSPTAEDRDSFTRLITRISLTVFASNMILQRRYALPRWRLTTLRGSLNAWDRLAARHCFILLRSAHSEVHHLLGSSTSPQHSGTTWCAGILFRHFLPKRAPRFSESQQYPRLTTHTHTHTHTNNKATTNE